MPTRFVPMYHPDLGLEEQTPEHAVPNKRAKGWQVVNSDDLPADSQPTSAVETADEEQPAPPPASRRRSRTPDAPADAEEN